MSLQETNVGHFCGGSLLTDTAFATAAHCNPYYNYYAVAGTTDNQSGQRILSTVFITHPRYNSVRIVNDYAVGKVVAPFTLNAYALPIKLVDPSSYRPADGHPLQTSGYGKYQMGSNGQPIDQSSQYLKWTDMKYVSVQKCESIWDTIDNSVICADGPSVSICDGDSGGPLVIQERGETRLIGMTSWSRHDCKVDGFPQGFANIQWPLFNSWIRQNAQIWLVN